MSRSNRILAALSVLSILFLGTMATSETPPAEGPGIAPSGKSRANDRASVAGVTSGEWLLALSHLSVSREQQNLITPLVRSFLFQAGVWKTDIDPAYRKMLADYRVADAETRPQLLLEIKVVRESRPKFLKVKESILKSLDAAQKMELLRQVKQEKARIDDRLGRAKGAGQPRSATEPKAGNGRGSEKSAKPENTWRFMDDSESERHVDPAAAMKSKAESPPEAK